MLHVVDCQTGGNAALLVARRRNEKLVCINIMGFGKYNNKR